MGLRNHLLTSISLLVLFGQLAACEDAGNAGPEPAINLAVIPSSGDIQAVTFPLDAYVVTEEQQREISRAYELLLSKCLLRFGFDVPVGEPAGRPHYGLNRRFGLVDESTARLYGYRGVPRPTSNSRPFLARVPVEAKWLLDGQGAATFAGQPVPEGGCQEDSVRQLNAGILGTLEDDVVERLKHEALTRSRQDSRVRALAEKWKSCMNDAGFQYETPTDALRYWNQVHGGRSDGALSEDERIAALADVRCKKETGYLRTLAASVIAYETMLIEQNTEALRKARETTETTIRNAAKITASS